MTPLSTTGTLFPHSCVPGAPGRHPQCPHHACPAWVLVPGLSQIQLPAERVAETPTHILGPLRPRPALTSGLTPFSQGCSVPSLPGERCLGWLSKLLPFLPNELNCTAGAGLHLGFSVICFFIGAKKPGGHC